MRSLLLTRFGGGWIGGKAARLLAAAALFALPALQNPTRALAADYPCTAAGLDSAVAAGGLATFNCGVATTVSHNGTLNITKDLTIDGGGLLSIKPTANQQM